MERTKCPKCGVGIVGKHMARHDGSATCKTMTEWKLKHTTRGQTGTPAGASISGK